MDATITSYFENAGTPATGLTPTVNIWQVDVSPTVQLVLGDTMTEVGDGFYVYSFTDVDGFTEEGLFLVRTDGGVALGNNRFNIGRLGPDYSDLTEASSQNIVTAVQLMQTLIKYSTNRTRIDQTAMTLSIYDNDQVTPIKVFQLLDHLGNPSVTEVYERTPQ